MKAVIIVIAMLALFTALSTSTANAQSSPAYFGLPACGNAYTYLGCPGCPGCPDNPVRNPGELGCWYLGCPGCPGCPGELPVVPGEPGCLYLL